MAAAFLWFLTSRVKTPSQFPITVTSTHSLLDQIIGAQVLSTGSSPELDQIGIALKKQSALNAWAALCAAFAAALQAVDFIVT
ncbi:hypothetical protein CK217_20540 [Mesorhizobium loti]|uniref:Uncharacterized protein n=2 Tax=Mesorhizobium TaxID=68287 RepID=A0A1A5I7D9_RHILI|nr:hypothetical protein BAE41_19420 [Mesorhizobium loti]QGX79119.1 hypothetical protein EB234_21225 [Mesorhizobium japonicum R7A]OBP75149.1 hypothetical protein BAE42_05950 [Mesorhizobium loti]OBP76562.1 hypothetical protein BAE39_10620 [Mesorhizobium loti]OBP86738.1 hypothetical protein BAE38_19430 [Mesorhizobium loti]